MVDWGHRVGHRMCSDVSFSCFSRIVNDLEDRTIYRRPNGEEWRRVSIQSDALLTASSSWINWVSECCELLIQAHIELRCRNSDALRCDGWSKARIRARNRGRLGLWMSIIGARQDTPLFDGCKNVWCIWKDCRAGVLWFYLQGKSILRYRIARIRERPA